jgi:hypothetical protein
LIGLGLRLLERFWLGTPDTDGLPRNNQISYTLKFNAEGMTYDKFLKLVMEHQPTIRACSYQQVDSIQSIKDNFGYAPEEPISYEEYERLMQDIKERFEE